MQFIKKKSYINPTVVSVIKTQPLYKFLISLSFQHAFNQKGVRMLRFLKLELVKSTLNEVLLIIFHWMRNCSGDVACFENSECIENRCGCSLNFYKGIDKCYAKRGKSFVLFKF